MKDTPLRNAEDFFREELAAEIISGLEDTDDFDAVVACAEAFAKEQTEWREHDLEEAKEELQEFKDAIDEGELVYEDEINEKIGDRLFEFAEWLDKQNIHASQITRTELKFVYERYCNEVNP